MPAIHVALHGDHERTGREVGTDRLPIIHTTADWTVDALEHGMESGRTSIMLLIPVTVGGIDCIVAAETSLQMWLSAGTVLAAKFREEVEQPGWAKLSPATRELFLPRLAEGIRRGIPSATVEQSIDSANMVLDSFGADGPPIEWAS